MTLHPTTDAVIHKAFDMLDEDDYAYLMNQAIQSFIFVTFVYFGLIKPVGAPLEISSDTKK